MIEKEESKIIEKILKKAMFESRLKTIFNFSLLLVFGTYVGFIIYQTKASDGPKSEAPYFAVINIDGEISAAGPNNAHQRIKLLEEAFDDDLAQSIILKLNSPGGSPAHSKLIYERINALKKSTGKKVYGFVEDVCASGCYYIASAVDELYITPVSYVGSIGVKMPSWDITNLMDKLGVHNDTLSAGKNKLLLSPFHPKNKSTTDFVENNLLKPIHTVFINDVKKGRPALKDVPNDSEIFSGLIWSGSQAVKLGLADGISDIYKLREQTEGKPKFVNYEPKINVFKKLFTSMSLSMLGNIFPQSKAETPIF